MSKMRFMAKVMSNKKQLKKMVELLGTAPDIAQGVCSKSASQKLFKRFTPLLNELGPPEREWYTWMRVWADLKCKIKKKKCQKTHCPPGECFNPRIHFNEMEAAVIRLLDKDTDMGIVPAIKPVCEDSNILLSSSDDDDDLYIVPTDEDMLRNISFEPLTNLDSKENDTQVVKNEPLSPKFHHENNSDVHENYLLTIKEQPSTSLRHIQNELHEEEFFNLAQNLESLKEGCNKVLQEQTSFETQFFKTMIDCMIDIRRSMDNIEDYMKASVDSNAELIELKRQKLKDFAKDIWDDKSERQAELQVRSQLLENEKRKLNELRSQL